MTMTNNTLHDVLAPPIVMGKNPPAGNGPCPAVPGSLTATVNGNGV